jgi:RNA polymerase sigma-70 factor, ECF subfamily
MARHTGPQDSKCSSFSQRKDDRFSAKEVDVLPFFSSARWRCKRKGGHSMNLSEPVDAGAKSIPCSPKFLSDELLVVRAKAGDTVAFVELRERHSTKVLRTLYRITRNWEDAEDALQESLLKAFRHLSGFENRSSFSSWLTRIAINSALMTLRKRKACKEVSIDSTDDCKIFGRLEPQDLSEDPERRYARCESEELLNGAMLQLEPAFRDVIQLRQMEEYSIHELAESLGISLPAAKSRLLRARRALRTILQ